MPSSPLIPCRLFISSSAATAARPLLLRPPSTKLVLGSAAAVASSSLQLEKRRGLCTAAMAGMAGSSEEKKQAAGGAGGVSERIMPHLINIYGSCATARDFEIYAPDATFEDPLMRAHGVQQIKSAFYSLPKVFGESRIAEYTVEENPTGRGKTEVSIDNRQVYRVLGRVVEVASLIRLDVDLQSGKVVKHEDWWDRKPLKTRDTVAFPLAGRVAEAARRGAMLLTHALMGFGKDPSS